MKLDPQWIPMKWPCGPLDWARRSKATDTSAELQQTLAAWAQPVALDLLKGTPVNCLLVNWAEGAAEDSAQQQALKPLLEAGRRRGLNFVGMIAAREGAGAAVESARVAGISAVMLAEPSIQSFGLPVIGQFPRDKLAWESATPIFSSTGNDWPGLKVNTMEGDTAIAGATGVPWVDSNAWFSLLANELAPGKTRWLDFAPPIEANLAHPASYALAVADSLAFGSRWIISLGDQLRAALGKGNPQATRVWSVTCETLSFFANHREWEGFKSQGILAVVSSFRGDNAPFTGEVLNLLNRRRVQFQVMERSRALATPTPGLKAILWLDKDFPSANQFAKLLAFVRQGGLLIASDYWGPSEVIPKERDPSLDYKMYNIGQGQIAVSTEGFEDAFQVAVDAHLLVGRRNDIVRLYNPATNICHASFDPVHRKQLVQVLNYSSEPASFVTLWASTRARSARLWSPEKRDSLSIPGEPAAPGTEFALPTFNVNCAIEMEGLRP
jgi:hypothetical protein